MQGASCVVLSDVHSIKYGFRPRRKGEPSLSGCGSIGTIEIKWGIDYTDTACAAVIHSRSLELSPGTVRGLKAPMIIRL
jgi:hypothetical protein